MNPVRALDFNDDDDDGSSSSMTRDDVPTANTSVEGEDYSDITTSLDNGKKIQLKTKIMKEEEEQEGEKGKNGGMNIENGRNDVSLNNDSEESFDSNLSLEKKFESLQNYVKGLSLDEWMYPSKL